MTGRWQILAALALAVIMSDCGSLAAEVDFEQDIVPLLAMRCLECHNAREAKGGLDLSSRRSALQGGDSGPVLKAGEPDASYLLERVAAGEMPPEKKGDPQSLPAAEVSSLRKWIAEGAPWPSNRTISLYERTTGVRAGLDWWALQPVDKPGIPRVEEAARPRNPIDAFIQAGLDAAGMEPAPPADRRVLVRRAYFDLTGLPPTPEQVAEFVADDSPDAYERLVDRLLASHHYGERWARYWLDLVRFAETCGYERDQLKPDIWRYRDWVIDAFNSDMPYDRFVRHQLAGDEVPDRDEQSVIATGMLRAGTWNDEPNDPADYVYTRLEDMVHTTTSAFLGLTVKCARCHDHKFDPIRQTDYYRTASFFWSGYIGQENLGGPTPQELGYDVFGWTDKGSDVEPIRLLIKGERHRPGPVVEPGFLSAIPALDRPLDPPPPGSATTRRRLQFAVWITDKRNPLTARVFVNRLWQHHFGEAIVRTPNNFGFKSDPPTHPRLLDWLAAELMEGEWTVKRMQKLIMTSATYRQASVHPRHEQYGERDYLNRLWWRFPRRRLDAEALRDAMLAASGQLNRRTGGPSFYPKISPEALEGLSRKENAWQTSSLDQRSRRSIYMMTKRSRLLPLMTTFDFGDTTLPCGKRDVTVVAPQALALLNNHFVHAQSQAMADRILEEVGGEVEDQVERAWQLALGRSPSREEAVSAAEHLHAQRAHFAAHREEQTDAANRNPATLKVLDKLALWLRADDGVEVDGEGRVTFWRDRSPVAASGLLPHDASQPRPEARPRLVTDAVNGRPALHFDGKQQFLQLAGQVLWSSQFSIFAVVTHEASEGGPREIFSNWHRRGRSVTSIFLGTNGRTGLRFTDAFAPAGKVRSPTTPFILTGISAAGGAATYQNREKLLSSGKLSPRDLGAPYVIGTQGNYGHEWWLGQIAEILVYDRPLDEDERSSVWDYLSHRYGLALEAPAPLPQRASLASLCHVLLNTNEFLYID